MKAESKGHNEEEYTLSKVYERVQSLASMETSGLLACDSLEGCIHFTVQS